MKIMKQPKFKVGEVVRFVGKWWLEESSEIASYKLATQENKAGGLERIEDWRGIISGCDGGWLMIKWFGAQPLSLVDRKPQHLKVYRHCEGMRNSVLCAKCKYRTECLPFTFIRHFLDWVSSQERPS